MLRTLWLAGTIPVPYGIPELYHLRYVTLFLRISVLVLFFSRQHNGQLRLIS